MTRLLALLLAILIALVLGEEHLRQSLRREHAEKGALRLLTGLDVQQVAAMQIQAGGRPESWTYVRRGNAWRYPAYFDAFVDPGRAEFLLSSLLQTPCTFVGAEPGDLARYGLAPRERLRLALYDGAGAPLLEVWVGKGVPAPSSGEAYAQRAGSDTVYHLHANPRLALDAAPHPLLDPHVLPRALERKPTARIGFAAEPSYPLRSLRRVQTQPAAPPLPGLPPQGPTFAWIAELSEGEKTCVAISVSAYVDFLQRLRYAGLRDAQTPFPVRRALYLEDEEGRVDTLEVGPADQSPVLIRHRSTGQVLELAPQKAALLFPQRPALLDTLPEPSPYRLAEP